MRLLSCYDLPVIGYRRNVSREAGSSRRRLDTGKSSHLRPVIWSFLIFLFACSGSRPTEPILDHLVIPGYPPLAKGARVEAEVSLQYSIQPDGRVEGVKVLSGSHPLLDDRLIRAVQEWKYRPSATADPRTRQVTFRLRLEEAEEETEKATFDPPDRVEILARVRLLGPSH